LGSLDDLGSTSDAGIDLGGLDDLDSTGDSGSDLGSLDDFGGDTGSSDNSGTDFADLDDLGSSGDTGSDLGGLDDLGIDLGSDTGSSDNSATDFADLDDLGALNDLGSTGDSGSDLGSLDDFGGDTGSSDNSAADFAGLDDLGSTIDSGSDLGTLNDLGNTGDSGSDLGGLDDLGGDINLDDLGTTSDIEIDSVMDTPEVGDDTIGELASLDDEASIPDLESFSPTDEAMKDSNEELDDLSFSISGFTDIDDSGASDFSYETPGASFSTGDFEDMDSRSSFTEDEYAKFKKNLAKYPLNLRVELEKIIADDAYKDDAIFEIIEKIIKGATARQIASYLQKYLDVDVSVPRDYERRTAEQYAAYKKSLEYQLKNRILPLLAVAVVFGFLCWGLFVFTEKFIYRPAMADKNYKAGYSLLQEDMFPQSEIKFNEAVSYKPKKGWYLKYAQGYRDKKQYDRARAMYERTIKVFNHDKTAGMEWAKMELYDLYNYQRAEQLVKREILDNHINDPDGMLLLGDVYLEWATEKDPSKFEEALIHYNDVNNMYGPNVEYDKRFMRYYIRTNDLKTVLAYKAYFYPDDVKEAKRNKRNKKVLTSADLIELSEYLMEKLYGPLPPNEEYLRSHIENVRQLLDMAVEADKTVPEAYYNLARYFIQTENQNNSEILLTTSLKLFENAADRKPERIQKNIDAYRLLGELYVSQQQYLLAEETYGQGIKLFEDEQEKSFLKPTEKIGHLYSDVGDLDYFISGNTDIALANYKKAIENGYETPSVNYRIGYIEYADKNYSEALKSFLKVNQDKYYDRNLMFAIGNVLSLRNDDYSSQGYYQRLLEDLDRDRNRVLMPQVKTSDAELVDLYMKTSNNLGVVLHRLANRTGNSQLNAQSMVMFSDSIRAWDSLTRNPETLIRIDGSNLASQNMKYVSHPYSNFSPAIYIEIPRTLDGEKVLEQTFVK
ncbi:MAG: tetratricopeptide repeat protein, partial [Treponemataceae bacterium]|nr:tetratricopeptide repeat protein [Treponemataceae bacterium]